jgi:ATP-dependent exoDNAse (exonuclease V) alpha subunit
VVKIPRGKATESGDGDEPVGEEKTATGCSWDLGYCLSVHKFQGSEIPWAIIVGDEYPGAKRLCDRAWIYTAISRAKHRCILIGKKTTFDGMCRKQSLAARKTLLKERILLEQAKLQLANL